MEENKKQDEVNYINFEDADNFEINSEDIFINKPNENPNNKDNSVKNEETNNTTELKEDSKLEEVDPSKKICPQCKNECDNEDLFCNKCGHKFDVPEPEPRYFCPKCGNEYTLEDLFCKKCGLELDQVNKCPHCGAKYETGDVFCGKCGTKLPTLNIMDKIMYSIPVQRGNTTYNPPSDSNDNSGCGCGCATIITGLCILGACGLAYIGQEIDIPYIGEATGIVLVGIVVVYFLPAIIAEARKAEGAFAIFLLDLLLGWTLLGWLVAFVLALCLNRRR